MKVKSRHSYQTASHTLLVTPPLLRPHRDHAQAAQHGERQKPGRDRADSNTRGAGRGLVRQGVQGKASPLLQSALPPVPPLPNGGSSFSPKKPGSIFINPAPLLELQGLWRGTEVAIKTMMLSANLSGTEKREKMAIMEVRIVMSLLHPSNALDLHNLKRSCLPPSVTGRHQQRAGPSQCRRNLHLQHQAGAMFCTL